MELLKREISVIIIQQRGTTPTPNERQGKFKKSKLKLNKKEPGSTISAPTGKFCYFFLTFIFYRKLLL